MADRDATEIIEIDRTRAAGRVSPGWDLIRIG